MKKENWPDPVTPEQARNVLQSRLARRYPVALWGPPGASKTTTVSEAFPGKVVDMDLLTKELVDLRGLPVKSEGTTSWAPPADLAALEAGDVLLLDEFNVAEPQMQRAAHSLLTDRRVGGLALPKKVRLVATGNLPADCEGGRDPLPTVANRLVSLRVEGTVAGWAAWASGSLAPPEEEEERGPHVLRVERDSKSSRRAPEALAEFLLANPFLLSGPQPGPGEWPAWATPRSWEMAGWVLWDRELSLEEARACLAGCVGTRAAALLEAWMSLWPELPDARLVLEDKDPPLPSSAAAATAFAGVLGRAAARRRTDRALLACISWIRKDEHGQELSMALTRAWVAAGGRPGGDPEVQRILASMGSQA